MSTYWKVAKAEKPWLQLCWSCTGGEPRPDCPLWQVGCRAKPLFVVASFSFQVVKKNLTLLGRGDSNLALGEDQCRLSERGRNIPAPAAPPLPAGTLFSAICVNQWPGIICLPNDLLLKSAWESLTRKALSAQSALRWGTGWRRWQLLLWH